MVSGEWRLLRSDFRVSSFTKVAPYNDVEVVASHIKYLKRSIKQKVSLLRNISVS
jgi:hypothetical protein